MAYNAIVPRRHGDVINGENGLQYVPNVESALAVSAGQSNVSVRKLSSAPLHPLGSTAHIGDKSYRYVRFGTAFGGGGYLARTDDPTRSSLENISLIQTSVAAGETVIPIVGQGSGTSDLTNQNFAGGYMLTNDGAGEGYAYQVLAHDDLDISTTNTAKLTLMEPLVEGLATGSEVTMVLSPYWDVESTDTGDADEVLVGVTCNATSVGDFGWVQFRGPAAVYTSGTLVQGDHVRAGGASGAVRAFPSTAETKQSQIVGTVMVNRATTEFSLVWLTLG